MATGSGVFIDEWSPQTSLSLLQRLRERDAAGWARFVRLYGPLLYAWCRQAGLQPADAEDVSQKVFEAVDRAIGGYRHDRPGDSFLAWLRIITGNKIRDHLTRGEPGGAGGTDAQWHWENLAAPEPPSAAVEDERLGLLRRALDLILEACEEKTRAMFVRFYLREEPAADVARDLGVTTNAVYTAKARILARLRHEFADLVEPEAGGDDSQPER